MRGHCTETAPLRVFSGILDSIEPDQQALPPLLYLSAAFDKVDHKIFIQRLSRSFGIKDTAFSWLESNNLSIWQRMRCNPGWSSVVFPKDQCLDGPGSDGGYDRLKNSVFNLVWNCPKEGVHECIYVCIYDIIIVLHCPSCFTWIQSIVPSAVPWTICSVHMRYT